VVATCVRILLGCYRRGEAEDGEIYTKAVTAVLAQFPESVVRAVCDPRTGLPVRSQFLPTLFEIRAACDASMRPAQDAERRARIEAERVKDQRLSLTEADSARRKAFIAEWRRTHPEAALAGARPGASFVKPGPTPSYLDKPCTLSPAALAAITKREVA
jgi:hypothetical protein